MREEATMSTVRNEAGAGAQDAASRCETRSETQETADRIAEAEGAAAFYGFGAWLLLEPVPVPGSAFAQELRSRTEALVTPMREADLPGTALVDRWLSSGEAAQDATAEQQELAVDRTRLCRGLNQRGPLPPYEAYFPPADAPLSGGASADPAPSTAVSRCYAAADIHPAQGLGERDDFLGVELAFAAALARSEAAALRRGDADEADRLARLRDAFEDEHLCRWAPRWCAEAQPAAQTDFFRGMLALLEQLLG